MTVAGLGNFMSNKCAFAAIIVSQKDLGTFISYFIEGARVWVRLATFEIIGVN